MKKTGLIIICLLAINVANAQPFEKNFIDQNYIEVTGLAKIELTPDEIYVNVTINEKDNKGKESLEQLERNMLKKLQEIGIDMKNDLAVLDFTSNFKEYWLKKSDIFTSKTYQIIAHNGKTVGMIFQELEKLNISNINIAKLDHSKIEEHRRQVKVEAVKVAKEKADAMTSAIGLKTGKALYIQEVDDYYIPRPMMKTANFEMSVRDMADAAVPEIDFEKIKLEYKVIARFAIE